MKIALCFSGQPRYLKECYPAIYKNLLEKYSPDVFVHTWWDESMPNKKMDLPSSLSYNRTYFWEEDSIDIIKNFYSPKVLFHEKQIEFETYSNVDYMLSRPSNVHSMFYSLEQSNKIKTDYEKENKFIYDAVIRCRLDTVFPVFDIDFYNIDLGYINCFVMGHGVLNDQFAISTSKNMNKYSTVYSSLDEYQKSGFTKFIGEELLTHHLNTNGLNWNNSKIVDKLEVSILIK